jgi:hypothetical protein
MACASDNLPAREGKAFSPEIIMKKAKLIKKEELAQQPQPRQPLYDIQTQPTSSLTPKAVQQWVRERQPASRPNPHAAFAALFTVKNCA